MTALAEQVERAVQRWNAGDLPGYLEVSAEDLRSTAWSGSDGQAEP